MGTYGWDLMAVHSIWAFGPSPSSGANMLLDDTLGSKALVNTVRSHVTQVTLTLTLTLTLALTLITPPPGNPC